MGAQLYSLYNCNSSCPYLFNMHRYNLYLATIINGMDISFFLSSINVRISVVRERVR